LIEAIDHLVLTVRSVDESCRFYGEVLGLQRLDAPGRPTALLFGGSKINLHASSHTFEPKAKWPTVGAGDFCLVSAAPIEAVVERLAAHGVPVEVGPVERQGARGPMMSVYFRDPDGNLVEVSHYG
jgi:catechol 2,3-dioxygenase-like lactoylglutathione lyase family enzyme